VSVTVGVSEETGKVTAGHVKGVTYSLKTTEMEISVNPYVKEL